MTTEQWEMLADRAVLFVCAIAAMLYATGVFA